MVLIPAACFSRRARVSTAAAIFLGAAGAGPVQVHGQQQARGIRFGRIWSYFHEESHRATCRRTRRVRYQYTESTIHKSGWEGYPFARHGKDALKRIMHDCLTPHGNPRPSGKSVNSDLDQSIKKPKDAGHDGNMGNVEQSSMEHFLFGETKSSAPYKYNYWQSPWQNICNHLRSQRAQMGTSAFVVESTPGTAPGLNSRAAQSYIDPVTNRRVPLSTGTDIPVRTFQADQSRREQNAEQSPIFYDGPRTEAELGKSRVINLDPIPDWECVEPTSKRMRPVKGSSGPRSAESSLHRGSVAETRHSTENPSKYDDLAKYRLTSDKSDTARTETAEVNDFHSPEEGNQRKVLRRHEPNSEHRATGNRLSEAAELEICDTSASGKTIDVFANHIGSEIEVKLPERCEPRTHDENPVSLGDLDAAEARKYLASRHHIPDGNSMMAEGYLAAAMPPEVEMDDTARVSLEDGQSRERVKPTNYQKMLRSLMPGHILEPALDRHENSGPKSASAAGRRAVADQGAKRGLGGKAAISSAGPEPTSPEPTLYKILAYDATMQTVSVAETTSVAPDRATSLSPAEVVPRLSNPTKFFPHFGPLQAQGFEIVSGSGDVLVFRRVRPATAEVEGIEEARTPALGKQLNPIDMTGYQPLEYGGTAASRFASPTGFVNYDLLLAPKPARFVSGIHVRREEDVFSGAKKARQQHQGKARKSLARRLAISAAWVGGVSYAVGVVSEYFKTGGSDGVGPQGF